LLANFSSDQDWNFEIAQANTILSGPVTASAPYQASFKALKVGTATITAFGRCHEVAGRICNKAIVSMTFTIVVS
jgi:hypothetical protein